MTIPTPIEVTPPRPPSDWTPTDADVEHLAIVLVAEHQQTSVAAVMASWASHASDYWKSHWVRLARAALTHAGFPPSLLASCVKLRAERDHALSQVPDPYWKPTDEDIAHLSVALLAGYGDTAFTEAKKSLEFSTDNTRERWLRVAHAAFEHPGYLPSIVAARQDHVARIKELEAERNRALLILSRAATERDEVIDICVKLRAERDKAIEALAVRDAVGGPSSPWARFEMGGPWTFWNEFSAGVAPAALNLIAPEGPVTPADMIAWFGVTYPPEVMKAVWDMPPETTVAEVRALVRKMAMERRERA